MGNSVIDMQRDVEDFMQVSPERQLEMIQEAFEDPNVITEVRFRRAFVCPNTRAVTGETHDGKLVEIDIGQEY